MPVLTKAPAKEQETVKVPLLIGVRHMDEDAESPKVLALLESARKAGAQSVALELRKDYKEMEEKRIGGYFSHIADAAERLGMMVIPLDDAKLLDENSATATAWHYCKGGRADFEQMESDEKHYLRQRQATGDIEVARFLDEALLDIALARELMQKRTVSEIRGEFNGFQEERDRRFAISVKINKPDVVIAGYEHSRVLKGKAGEKQYVELL